MTQSSDDDYNKCYDVPLEELGISDNAIEMMKMVGITSIGDCLDMYWRGETAMIQVPLGVIDAYVDEVHPRLLELGYVVEND